jgi:hypothetical protein
MKNGSTVFRTDVDEQKAEICNVAPLLLPQEKELEDDVPQITFAFHFPLRIYNHEKVNRLIQYNHSLIHP